MIVANRPTTPRSGIPLRPTLSPDYQPPAVQILHPPLSNLSPRLLNAHHRQPPALLASCFFAPPISNLQPPTSNFQQVSLFARSVFFVFNVFQPLFGKKGGSTPHPKLNFLEMKLEPKKDRP
jgi:hypothetical protein